MTEPDGGSVPGTTAAPAGRIVLAFDGPAADCRVTVDPDVSPGQVYMAAYLLDLIAHEIRTGQLMAAATGRPGLAVPGADDVTRVVQDLMRGRH